jgi:hypothetical protein
MKLTKLNTTQYDTINKILKASKMDTWFYLDCWGYPAKPAENGIVLCKARDLEKNGKQRPFKKMLSEMLEGMEGGEFSEDVLGYKHYKLTEEEIMGFEQLCFEIGLEKDLKEKGAIL